MARSLALCGMAALLGLLAVAGLLRVMVVSAGSPPSVPPKGGKVGRFSPLWGELEGGNQLIPEIAGGGLRGGALSPHLGYGLNVRDPAHLEPLFAPLGFEWIKLYEQYNALPTERWPYKVLYRIQLDGPPDDLDAWGDHVAAIARAGQGLVEAYEIGNEPNQSWQWGHQVPDPEEFVAALKIAYARIKAIDPQVTVVSGGLGPVGRIEATPAGEGWPGNNGASMDEWEYARAMFSRCLTGCLDAFGYHPFGFAYTPEITPALVSNNFAFRGAEDLRQIMLDHDLGHVPMWATEFGWIRDPDPDGYGWCKLVPEFNEPFGWMLVDQLQQADYLRRALVYADAHWPWMEAMFVWNLDWNDQGWECSDIRFFSLRYVDGGATPAYDALAALEKRPGPAGCRLQIEPAAFDWRTLSPGACGGTALCPSPAFTGVVSVTGLAGCDAITWTARLDPNSTLRPTLPVTRGRLGHPLTLTVDAGAALISGTGTLPLYPSGTYTALVTLTTTPSDVIGSPETVRVTLTVLSAAHAVNLPLVLRLTP